jgi:hypothetical protein
MYDPVHVPFSSVSYERQEILKWLDASDDETCPVSGNPLQRKSLVRNITLADEISDWYQQRQQNTGFSFTDKANTISAVTRTLCGFVPSTALLDSLPSVVPCGTKQASSDRDRLNNLLSILDEAVACCN